MHDLWRRTTNFVRPFVVEFKVWRNVENRTKTRGPHRKGWTFDRHYQLWCEDYTIISVSGKNTFLSYRLCSLTHHICRHTFKVQEPQTNAKQLQEQEAKEMYEQWLPLHTGSREQVSPCKSRTVSQNLWGPKCKSFTSLRCSMCTFLLRKSWYHTLPSQSCSKIFSLWMKHGWATYRGNHGDWMLYFRNHLCSTWLSRAQTSAPPESSAL